jgi:hypothetical protein
MQLVFVIKYSSLDIVFLKEKLLIEYDKYSEILCYFQTTNPIVHVFIAK